MANTDVPKNATTICLLIPGLGDAQLAQIQGIAPRAELLHFPETRDREADVRAALRRSHVVFGSPRLEWLADATALRWLHLPSAGADRYVTDPTLAARGVVLTNSTGVYGIPISEHVFALLLALTRQIHQNVRNQARATWQRTPGIGELFGRTMGILGLGDIGTEVAKRAHAFGMRVLAVKRRITTADAHPFVERLFGPDGIDTVIAESDYLVLCLPGTPAVQNVLSAERISRMKRGSVVVNIGRGRLIDEPALIEALKSGHLAGAGLDVFVQEPLPPTSPLWGLPNVIITPHQAGTSPEHVTRATAIFCDNLRRFMSGQPLHNLVDRETGY